MEDNKKGSQSASADTEGGNQAGILDSDFIPLGDLVFAPLQALASSNRKLRESVVTAVKNLGTVRQSGQEEIIYLNNVNIAYDHIRPDTDDGYSVENLQLQVPLLSIVPVTNLNVDKAKIAFSTEIRTVNEGNDKYKINGRICSPEQRETDFLPKVSYSMQVSSMPATEGMQRLTDLLSANQVAKQLDSTPVAVDGNLHTEDHKEIWQANTDMKAKVKKLNGLYQKIADMIEEQEKLQQISDTAFPGDTYRFDKDKYLRQQSDIANEVMKLKAMIMDQEIELSKEKADG